MHNEAHFYCSSSESRERAECGKPEQTLSQSRCGTIGPDLCPEEMQANKEPEHQNRNMVICFETKIEALLWDDRNPVDFCFLKLHLDTLFYCCPVFRFVDFLVVYVKVSILLFHLNFNWNCCLLTSWSMISLYVVFKIIFYPHFMYRYLDNCLHLYLVFFFCLIQLNPR